MPAAGAKRVRDPSDTSNGEGPSFGELGWGIRLTEDDFKGGPNRVRRGQHGRGIRLTEDDFKGGPNRVRRGEYGGGIRKSRLLVTEIAL